MIRVLKNPYNTAKVRTVLHQLRQSERPQDQLLAGAVATFLTRSASPEESAWIERIKSLRNQLMHSTEKLAIVDWGLPRDAAVGTTVDRHVSTICRAASTPPLWGLLMFALIRHFKPATCLELGTSLGISAAYQSVALELNGYGKMVSMEGAPTLADVARRNLRQLGVSRAKVIAGRFQDTLEGVLARLGSIDFVFIDGHHDGHATQTYFRQILPYVTSKAVVVLDDITYSSDMRIAWHAIVEDKSIVTAVDLAKWGICLLDRDAKPPAFKLKLISRPSLWQKAVARVAFAR
jgi:predicted O-methyltransferase YrrM